MHSCYTVSDAPVLLNLNINSRHVILSYQSESIHLSPAVGDCPGKTPSSAVCSVAMCNVVRLQCYSVNHAYLNTQ